jgi:hypothetical protein
LTRGVFGRFGTCSLSCVEYNSAVGVFERNKNPDLDLSNPDPESPFLNLLFVGEVVEPENIKQKKLSNFELCKFHARTISQMFEK